MPQPTLTNAEVRRLKAEAQHLDPVVYVGKNGLTPAVLYSLEEVLTSRQLIKVRLDHDREERTALAEEIARSSNAKLIWQVGKVAVFYRPQTPATS